LHHLENESLVNSSGRNEKHKVAGIIIDVYVNNFCCVSLNMLLIGRSEADGLSQWTRHLWRDAFTIFNSKFVY